MQALTLQNDVTFVEAARHLAARMLTEAGAVREKQILYGWRLVLSRPPQADELAVLVRACERYRTQYRRDRNAAQALLSHGETPSHPKLDKAEHAAFTMIAQTLLNLDETITQE